MSDREVILRKLSTNIGILVLIVAVVGVPLLSLRAVVTAAGGLPSDQPRVLTVLKEDVSDGITEDDMDDIADMDGIDTVSIGDAAGIYAETAGEEQADGWNGVIYEYRPAVKPDGVTDGFSLDGDEVLAPDNVDGHDFTIDLGRDITVASTVRTGVETGTLQSTSVQVAGTYGDTPPGVPTPAFFGSHEKMVSLLAAGEGVSEQEFKDEVGFRTASVTVAADGADGAVTGDDVDAVISGLEDRGYQASVDVRRSDGFFGVVMNSPMLIGVVLLAFILAAVVVGRGAARHSATRAGVVAASARGAGLGGIVGVAVGGAVVAPLVGVANIVPTVLVTAAGMLAVLLALAVAVSWTVVFVAGRRYGELGSTAQ